MELKLVECESIYWDFVRELRQDVRVIGGFVNNVFIDSEKQKSYMQKNSKNYRIALADGKPAGYVGVVDNDIRICTHPEYQKMGIGKFMISEITKIFPNAIAKIKIDNEASIKLFKSCGFNEKFIILEK